MTPFEYLQFQEYRKGLENQTLRENLQRENSYQFEDVDYIEDLRHDMMID